jgi:hypothetical protein
MSYLIPAGLHALRGPTERFSGERFSIRAGGLKRRPEPGCKFARAR